MVAIVGSILRIHVDFDFENKVFTPPLSIHGVIFSARPMYSQTPVRRRWGYANGRSGNLILDLFIK